MLRDDPGPAPHIRMETNMTEETKAKSGAECALDLAAKASEGIPWHLVTGWGEQIIREHQLEKKMVCGSGDMSGESHALLEHNGVVLRIKRDWMGHYILFRGEWRSDPHFAGD